MNRKILYLVLCVLGFALPYSQFVPWVIEHGLDMRLFVHSSCLLTASAASSAWTSWFPL